MPRKSLNLPGERRFKGPALLWKRMVAFIIDLLVIDIVLAFPFRKIILRLSPDVGFKETYSLLMNNPEFAKTLTIVSIFISILALLYFSITEYKVKQTVGKILMNIYVVSTEKKMRYWQCVVRNLFLFPVFPFFLLWVIDPVFLLFNKNGQRLSEVISKTRVVSDYKI